ncbi:MAG: InlB B-repeat-containing protein, partial [Ilumatobacteraceae bacterium]
VTYDAQGGSAVSDGSSVMGGSVAEAPDTPIRSGFTFVGWFVASSGGAAITFPYTHGQNTDFTLYAQWVQSSLYGLGSVTKIGTIYDS